MSRLRDARVPEEERRLAAERAAHVDRNLRSASSLALTAASAAAVVFGPLAPGAERLYGPAGAAELAPLWALGLAPTAAASVVLARFGSKHWAYLLVDGAQRVAMFGAMVATVLLAGAVASPWWVATLFSAAYFGITKPLQWRHHVVLMVANFLWLGLTLATFEGTAQLPLLGGVTAGHLAVYAVVWWRARAALTAEAARNIARADIVQASLDAERVRIDADLRSAIGADIASIVDDLRQRRDSGDEDLHVDKLLALAEGARAEVEGLVWGTTGQARIDVERVLRHKCGAICASADYQQSVAPELIASPMTVEHTRVVIRVAQELVRNAVVHGRASRVHLELTRDGDQVQLSVRDDGAGMAPDVFRSGTGGLHNARQWLASVGGTLALANGDADGAGTVLRARFPALS